MITVSIVILNYNTRDFLRACLRSIGADGTAPGVETIVVDNASTDDSVGMVREEFPGVQVIASERNLGFAGGNNLGMRRCAGRFVLLLNPDAELHPGALAALTGHMDAHPEAGATGASLLNTDGSRQPAAFGFPTVLRLALVMTRLSRLCGQHMELGRVHWPQEPTAVDWVTGACLMVRREVLGKVGGLDESYFLDYEDVDWCRRIGRAGWEIHAVPAAVATHHRWKSKAQASEKTLLGEASAFKYFRTYHGSAAGGIVRALLVGLHTLGWAKYSLRTALTGALADRHKRQLHWTGVVRFTLQPPGPSL